MKDKHHCYGNEQIFNKVVCFNDCCHFYYACRVATGDTVKMYEWKFVDLIINIVEKKEVLELLQKNYSISYNASKLAVRRWKKKQNV
jgi:hypothetical protein